ncbi:unnamed protein product [Symbiodinium sp. CCMP2592]|nr:unnamed protein product [Symbiodinium sp. CCMP2592]CAE7671559.1 unnamed protein product [Symbiodinium sp. CCMP2592]
MPEGLPPSFSVADKRDNSIVGSLAESYMIYDDMYDRILAEEGDEGIQRVLENLQQDSLSTAFSGVEAAATASGSIREVFSRRTGVELGPARVLHQVEWNEHCVKELLPLARKHDTCIFRNIRQFFRKDLQQNIHDLLTQPQMAVEILGPLLAAGKAMQLCGDCVTHGKQCRLRPASRHIAGTSCRPFSRKGSGLLTADPEILFTLAWIGLRLELQETEIISENVRSHGSSSLAKAATCLDSQSSTVPDAGLGHLLIRFLGDKYWMERAVLDPCLLGFPVAREREFIVCHHKVKCLATLSPVSRFQKRFYRACAWSWHQFFFMHLDCVQERQLGVVVDELQEELRWEHDKSMNSVEVSNLQDTAVWESSLSAMEWRFLQEYRCRWPGTAYMLNQDPSAGHGHPANSKALFTLTSSMGLIWTDSPENVPHRWLAPTEALVCQGFPVVPFLHDSYLTKPICCFHVASPDRGGRHVFQQAGNSMHVAVMAVLQLHTHSCVELNRPSPLMMQISASRQAVRAQNKRKIRDSPDGDCEASAVKFTDIPRFRLRSKSPAPFKRNIDRTAVTRHAAVLHFLSK